MKIIKRNGAEEVFDISKIRIALEKANIAVEEQYRMTALQISRIAEMLGYNLYSFSKAFKRMHGVSPKGMQMGKNE